MCHFFTIIWSLLVLIWPVFFWYGHYWSLFDHYMVIIWSLYITVMPSRTGHAMAVIPCWQLDDLRELHIMSWHHFLGRIDACGPKESLRPCPQIDQIQVRCLFNNWKSGHCYSSQSIAHGQGKLICCCFPPGQPLSTMTRSYHILGQWNTCWAGHSYCLSK